MEYWNNGFMGFKRIESIPFLFLHPIFQFSIIPSIRFFRRGVAQPGSALAWGVRCRRFKSSRPDHLPLSMEYGQAVPHFSYQ